MAAVSESESYLYITRDVEDSMQTPSASNLSQFDDKDELEIARYLDVKLNRARPGVSTQTTQLQSQTGKTNTASTSTSATTTSNTNKDVKPQPMFQSPATEKVWTPLMQSTPVDGPYRATQPKEILKSKLSKLAQSVENARDDTESSSSDEDEISRSPHDDTPSKSRHSSMLSLGDANELEELRTLKKFLCQVPNGETIVRYAKQGLTTTPTYRLVADSELHTQEKKVKELEEEVERLKRLNQDLKDETSTVKSTNVSLKEIIELKDKSIDESRQSIKELESSIQELNLAKDRDISQIVGDKSERISPARFPDLNKETSEGMPLYGFLELPRVDDLSLIESQNIIKNVLIQLNVPYTRIKDLVPQIALRLRHEGALVQFTTRTHRLLYNQEMNMEEYLKESTDQHLSQCTLRMFQNIELLYTVLNQTR